MSDFSFRWGPYFDRGQQNTADEPDISDRG
jgi:hypothetical protein